MEYIFVFFILSFNLCILGLKFDNPRKIGVVQKLIALCYMDGILILGWVIAHFIYTDRVNDLLDMFQYFEEILKISIVLALIAVLSIVVLEWIRKYVVKSKK